MIELRDLDRDYWTLSGLATTWSHNGQPYFVAGREGTFLEQVAQNAFSDATDGRDSVELRREHRADSAIYASTSAGTLKFADVPDGLMLSSALSKRDSATRTAVQDVRSGALGGLSVGMLVRRDIWGKAQDGRTELRTIVDAGLSEVSLVARPANPSAAILDVRHETRSAGEVEYRSVGVRYAEARRRYTDKQVQALGRAGKALRVGDHYAWPIADDVDLMAAVQSFGRAGSSAGESTVKQWIVRRARALGKVSLLPRSWGVKRSALLPNDSDVLWTELERQERRYERAMLR